MIKLKAIPVLENDTKLDGFHLMWNPLLNGHFPVKGYSIWRRKSAGRNNKPVCRIIDGTLLQSLHLSSFLLFPEDNNAFTKILYRPGNEVLQAWTGQTPGGPVGIAPAPTLSIYEARFIRAVFNVHVLVRIKPAVKFIAAVAFRDNKVVGSKYLTDALEFTFEEAIDKVIFYVPYIAELIRVCYEDPDPGKPEDWQLLKKDLTMPFAGFSSGVSTVNDEFAEFTSRIKDGDFPPLPDFERVSTLLRNSSPFAHQLMLPVTSTMQYVTPTTGAGNQLMNAAPFAMLQTFCQDHNWRAGLGFSYQDQLNLQPGERYDYKITATFHRRCLEKILNFHTVPLDTRVGPLFALGGIFFYVATRTRVESFPKNNATGNFIKGIHIESQALIIFPETTTHFYLYCFPSLGSTIKVTGSTDTYPVSSRVEIKLNTPGDRIILKGNFFITGIALANAASGADPNEKIEIADYAFNNLYANTPRLLPPTFLDATNLQDAWIANQKRAPVGLGFLLRWQQPPADVNAISPQLWPVGLQSPPPVNLGHYKLEYRKINSANPATWFPWDEEESPGNAKGMIFPGDDYTAAPAPMSFGADLLVIYPEGLRPETVFNNSQKFKHILNTLSGTVAFLPGTHYQYRIWTVDLVGRMSVAATVSAQRRLEKKQPPPTPAGLADNYIIPDPDPGYELPDLRFSAGDINSLLPKHVYVRVLQPNAPGLTTAERNTLGDRDKLTILTWTWGEDEKKLDPFVTEFRVYFRANEYGTIQGEYLSGAIPDGDNWDVPVQLSVPANSSEFVNHSILLNKVPFKILSHAAGNNITIRVASPLTVDKTPQAGRFQLFRKARGEEARPGTWDKRIAVIPVSENIVYQYVLETGTLLHDPANILGSTDVSYEITPAGSPLRCWLGVSAADSESYVDDQLTLSSTFSPRKGNEGSIAPAPVYVRFYGRPVFNPPPPLDDVDVQVLDEVKSDELIFSETPVQFLTFLDGSDRLIIQRISGSDLVALLHVSETAIQLSDAENPAIVTDWSLNPADELELRNAFFNSNRPIPAKFIYGIAKRNDLHLDQLWKQVNAEPVAANQPFRDLLANKMERYIYRAKLVNEIGITSEQAALFPLMWRSPDKSIPAPVNISEVNIVEEGDDGVSIGMTIKLPASFANGVKGILVFATAFPSGLAPTEQELKETLLLKIPNRPDLLSEQSCRVRVKDQLAEPVFFAIADSTRETVVNLINIVWSQARAEFGYDHHVFIWAVSVSVDNITSPLSTHQKLYTGPVPPVFPTLSVITGSNELVATYTVGTANNLMYRIEHSVSGTDEGFTVVKGWHKAKVGVNEMRLTPPAGNGWLRLVIKNNGRDYYGPTTSFNM